MQLHIFVFDEELKSLRGLGTAIDLSPFYNAGVSIVHACFVHGNEEILFVDSSAQARIFSVTSMQPKYFQPFCLHSYLSEVFLDPPLYNCHRYHVLFTRPRMGHVHLQSKSRMGFLP